MWKDLIFATIWQGKKFNTIQKIPYNSKVIQDAQILSKLGEKCKIRVYNCVELSTSKMSEIVAKWSYTLSYAHYPHKRSNFHRFT